MKTTRYVSLIVHLASAAGDPLTLAMACAYIFGPVLRNGIHRSVRHCLCALEENQRYRPGPQSTNLCGNPVLIGYPERGGFASRRFCDHEAMIGDQDDRTRPGHWSEPGEYNILFLGSILVISSQDSSALGYREFTQEGPMTISPFAAREGTSAPQWPNVKECCRHLVPSSDFFIQSYAVPR